MSEPERVAASTGTLATAGGTGATARPRRTGDELGVRVSAADRTAALEDAMRRAVGVVARRATGPADCRDLLGMLGLEKVAGLPVTLPGSDGPGSR